MRRVQLGAAEAREACAAASGGIRGGQPPRSWAVSDWRQVPAAVDVGGPVGHQPAPPLEQIRAGVSRLDLVLHDMNIAENELSALTRQCLRGRRIGDSRRCTGEVSAWSGDVNGTQRGVDWQMKVQRCSL